MVQHRRGPWSQQEDATLLQLVQLHGPHNWVRISQLVGSRSPKQCRERYHQNLKPTLNHEPITPEEGVVIEKLVGEMGKRWAEIARRLHGRSDNAVKNWWNGGMNRRRRLCLRQRSDSRDDGNDMGDMGDMGDLDLADIDEEESEYLGSVPSSPNGFSHGLPTIDSTLETLRIDESLRSPSIRTEFSRGATPSLISDSTSTLSLSPRIPPSPGNGSSLTLPPLMGHHDSRRTSLSVLSIRSAQSMPEYRTGGLEGFGYSRYSSDKTRYTQSLRKPSSEIKEGSQPYNQALKTKPTAQSLFDAKTVRTESRRKDSRMNLANICS
ncbi:hypothetical protein DFH27DRAFT_173696 [Peziza echinospora]|nr:hypothetical protein DFH27DRAFT_173696 [Peziza echinospora]